MINDYAGMETRGKNEARIAKVQGEWGGLVTVTSDLLPHPTLLDR